MIEPTVAVRQMPMAQHASVGRYCVGARSVRAQCVTPDMRGRRPKAALRAVRDTGHARPTAKGRARADLWSIRHLCGYSSASGRITPRSSRAPQAVPLAFYQLELRYRGSDG